MSKFLISTIVALGIFAPFPVLAEQVTYKLVNGDTITGELVPEESSDDIRVLIHPFLGRLEIDVATIKPDPVPPLWKTSISAGLNGNNSDGDSNFTGSLSASSLYKDEAQSLALAGSFNYNRVNKVDSDPEIKTKNGAASVNYTRAVSSNLDLYAGTNYNYNYLKTSGVDNVLVSVGVGFPVVESDQTTLNLSVGPSIQWLGGGKDCSTDEYCGNTYGGGTFTVDFAWKPSKMFVFGAQNKFSAAFASEVKPSNTFTASLKFFPSENSGLFTSLKYQSIYQSMATPAINNTITGQVGVEF